MASKMMSPHVFQSSTCQENKSQDAHGTTREPYTVNGLDEDVGHHAKSKVDVVHVVLPARMGE